MTKKFLALVLGVVIGGVMFVGCEKENNDVNDVVEDTIPQQSILAGFDENGASLALFSIGENKQVRFSRGNLQYRASTNTWRFAEHQYDFAGENNSNISENNNGWIDLFAWGTSGWESGAVACHPWDTSSVVDDYYTNGNLIDDNAEADWAWHNAIMNGGNQAHMWRTLTIDEWQYLIASRPNAASKRGGATIGETLGCVLLSDDFVMPDSLTFITGADGWSTNRYTLEEWAKMEEAGAIFLPPAGNRVGNALNATNGYWSTTNDSQYESLGFGFETEYIMFPVYWRVTYGLAIRPVMDNNQ